MSKNAYETKNKKKLMQYILWSKGAHFNALEVHAFFINEGAPISATTIYRQLEKLTTEGVLKKYRSPENDSALYYYIGTSEDQNQQPHMKCTACKQIMPLRCNTAQIFAQHLQNDHHFKVNLDMTVFYGTCENCAQ